MAKKPAGDAGNPDNAAGIPLLEAIVIPGQAAGGAAAKGKKKNTRRGTELPEAPTEAMARPAPTPSARPAAPSYQAAPQTSAPIPTDLSEELADLIAGLMAGEKNRILAQLEPHLAEDILPRLIGEVIQPEINAVYEEIKTITHGVESRTERQVRSAVDALERRIESFNKQTAALKPLADALKRLQEEMHGQRSRLDAVDTNASAACSTLEQKLDYVTQQFETRLKERFGTLDAAQSRLANLDDMIRRAVDERLATLEKNVAVDKLREQIQRLQSDVAALHRAAALTHQTEAELVHVREQVLALRDDQLRLLRELEERFDKAYLRRLAALPKLMSGFLQQQVAQDLEDRFDKLFLRRVATLPKLVENILKSQPRAKTVDRVQWAPDSGEAAPPPQQQAEIPVSMEKTYDPSHIETRWYEFWEKNGHFAPRGKNKPYCIMLPPPNVTGSLHMGHAFQDTIMDALIRYHRMRGEATLWQGGTDHAGIATQMVVERQLAAKGKTRHDLGREGFVKQVWHWKAESGGMITRQLRRMGASLDWSRERFTMDAGLSKAVREVFVQLYEEGLIYRGKRLVNWDPVLHTALSDLEVISQEEDGFLWHIRYPIVDGGGYLVVATTRPETLLGDAAVAVHPEDERYSHLVGKFVELPLANRRIPVIADEYVDREFGTGCVKITPAHDFNDYQVWQRHKDSEALRTLPQNGLINIFTIDAKVKKSRRDDESTIHRAPSSQNGGPDSAESGKPGTSDLIPEKYRGLDRFEARKLIVADLEAIGLLEKAQKHRLMVPRGDRSQAVVEPYLTDQWYVRAAPLAEPAIKAVENGEIRFIPENWTNTYYDWMRNIEDWCISRQIWWGHRIPAWYDRRGNVYVGRSEAEVRKNHDLPTMVPLVQDPDVLDTWFSSALWPFSTLGWPEQNEDLATFYPTNVLVTGFDIIFFWVARMIMMGLKFTGKVPFREVYIHGLVRDAEGQKMSKSKGNVLDPIDLIDGIDLPSLVAKRTSGLMQPEMAQRIEKATRNQFPEGIPAFGTDAMRFTFAALASTGRDIRFDTGRIEGYRNFCNKLWNASRFVLMNTEGKDLGQRPSDRKLSSADKWIRSRLQTTIGDVEECFKTYRFDMLASAIYEFTWNEYCDWYLELVKPVLHGDDAAAARGARHTLATVLETLLRLVHPIMPFVTEEIWQKVAPLAGKQGDTIMVQSYPVVNTTFIDEAATAEMSWLMEVVLGIRKIRGEMNINPGKAIPLLLQGGDDTDRTRFEQNAVAVRTLAKLDTVEWLADYETPPDSATALAGTLKLFVPMAGLIDKKAELARLEKEIAKLRKDLAQTETKLSNASFVDRAPPEVVGKERQRAADLRSAVKQLDEQLARIENL